MLYVYETYKDNDGRLHGLFVHMMDAVQSFQL